MNFFSKQLHNTILVAAKRKPFKQILSLASFLRVSKAVRTTLYDDKSHWK